MSKAFLRESDLEEVPVVPTRVATLPPGAKNLLTAAGARRLRAELADLDERARLHAGLSKGDPDVQPTRLALDQRRRELERCLQAAKVIAPPAAGRFDAVSFGATVTLDDAGETGRYRIVGVDEADATRGWISWTSPLARVLQNARRGDRIVFAAPRGKRHLKILEIEAELEA